MISKQSKDICYVSSNSFHTKTTIKCPNIADAKQCRNNNENTPKYINIFEKGLADIFSTSGPVCVTIPYVLPLIFLASLVLSDG